MPKTKYSHYLILSAFSLKWFELRVTRMIRETIYCGRSCVITILWLNKTKVGWEYFEAEESQVCCHF